MKRIVAKDMPDGMRNIICKNGGGETLAALNEQRRQKQLCDIVIKVGDSVQIYAHKNILAVNSDYFQAMFTEGFAEAHAVEISLHAETIDPCSVQALVDFMYSGQLPVNAETVQGLIMTASLWQMAEVKSLCEEYMERQINEENCLGISRFAEIYECPQLIKRSEQLLKQRFPLVAQGTEFLELSPTALQHILSLNDLALGPDGEDVVVRALCRWLDSNHDFTLDTLNNLIQIVHWAAISPACRLQLMSHPILGNNAVIQQQLETEEGRGKPVRKAKTTLYVIGGYPQERTGPKFPRLQSVERLDSIKSAWTSCADLPMKCSTSVALNLHGHLLVCACEPIELPNRSSTTATRTDIYEYYVMRDEWVSVSAQWSIDAANCINACLQAEGAMAVCQQNSAIYVVSNQEVAVINYNILEGDVFCRNIHLLPRPQAYFTEKQRYFSTIVMDQVLYVLGGDRRDAGNDPIPIASVIVFDRENRVWQPRADMLEPRVQMSVATLNCKIYACGGFNTRRLASTEMYDPTTDQWTALHPMIKYRSHHQLLVMDNKLWAIGGKSYTASNGAAKKVLNQCEVYNAEIDRWSDVQASSMKFARCAFAAVAI